MTLHEPLLFWSRQGAWACCPCGWTSGGRWSRTFGAHLAFGRHLLHIAHGHRAIGVAELLCPECHPLAEESA